MSERLANRTGQSGIYTSGSPDYVDVDNTYTVLEGMVSFATKAADTSQPQGAWDDGDIISVLVYETATKWQVWLASWDATNEYLELVDLEDSSGTLTDPGPVLVTGVLTAGMTDRLVNQPRIVTVSGTTHTTLDEDCGALHVCTNGSAVTVTLGSDNRAGWHGLFLCQGAGLVSFARASTDTINGDTANVDSAGQYKTAYAVQPTEGVWVVAV